MKNTIEDEGNLRFNDFSEAPLLKEFPCNIGVEKSVLGGFLLDNNLIDENFNFVFSDYFFSHKNKIIYEGIKRVYDKFSKVDILLLCDDLEKTGSIEEAGGREYVNSLQDELSSLGLVEHYIKILREKKILRNIISSASNLISSCYSYGGIDVEKVIEKAENVLFEIAKEKTNSDYVKLEFLLRKIFNEFIILNNKNSNGITGVPSGYLALDNMSGGFQKGDLIILAARPSMGKTALALCMAKNISKQGISVGIISLEMSSDQLVFRLISSEAEIRLSSLRSGNFNSNDLNKLTEIAATMANLKIFIDDNAMQTISEIKTKARKLIIEHGVQIIILDYLQLLHTSKRHESRQVEVSEISRFLKCLAKELKIPIIALSQLSRGVENRVDKRPILSDLRDSGAIEQDADLILFLYRDVVYNPETEFPELAEIIIGKQRNGPTGNFQLRYHSEYTSFEEL